jgi:hypothetical protein
MTIHSIVPDDPEDLVDPINTLIDGNKVIHIAYLLKQHAVGAVCLAVNSLVSERFAPTRERWK